MNSCPDGSLIMIVKISVPMMFVTLYAGVCLNADIRNICRKASCYKVSLFRTKRVCGFEFLNCFLLETVESFVEELEWRISLELYGRDTETKSCNDDSDPDFEDESELPVPQWRVGLPKPKKCKSSYLSIDFTALGLPLTFLV